jgi:hypothetical protein
MSIILLLLSMRRDRALRGIIRRIADLGHTVVVEYVVRFLLVLEVADDN